MDSKFRLILCVPPGDAEQLRQREGLLAPPAYRIGPGPSLQRIQAVPDLRGGILTVTDGGASLAGNPQYLCRQVQREAAARRVMGVWLDLQRRPLQEARRCLAALDGAVSQAGLELWVPEWCAEAAPHGNVLISSALSGGSLKARLDDAITAYGLPRVTLAVEPMAEDFTLPAADGQGRPLAREELQTMLHARRPNVFYSGELCAHYFTFLQQGMPHFILFDNAGSVREKLALAGQLSLRFAAVPWEYAP
ncbi:MAG: hypothetical protein LUC48_03000 [Clostridiales bacterium]|nr:hypothetical protein [Clostridiales bacterium]